MDKFSAYADHVAAPARSAVSVSPSDTTDLTSICKALYIGGGGDVAVILADDTASVVMKNVNAGTVLPLRARRVLATGTNATTIVALS